MQEDQLITQMLTLSIRFIHPRTSGLLDGKYKSGTFTSRKIRELFVTSGSPRSW